MQPKSYTVFKWAVYALATLLFFALQGLVLDHVRVWGLTPFLYPILPAVEAMYEGPRRGPVFALVMGLFCDILIWGPFEGFYALSFTIIALISAVIGENMLTPGTFCALLVSVGALLGEVYFMEEEHSVDPELLRQCLFQAPDIRPPSQPEDRCPPSQGGFCLGSMSGSPPASPWGRPSSPSPPCS